MTIDRKLLSNSRKKERIKRRISASKLGFKDINLGSQLIKSKTAS